MITVYCAKCSKVIQRWPRDLRRSKTGKFYCSYECRRNQVLLICKVCGKEFYISASAARRRKTCSKSCGYRLTLPKMVRCNPTRQYNRLKRNCLVCSVEFETVPSTGRKYCSRECAVKGWKLGYTKIRPWARVTKACETCHKIFEVLQSASHQRFCSMKCKGIWQSYAWRGENHPGWKGGRDPYYGKNWRRQKREARRRDQYTCQDCGVAEKSLARALDVHHIIPFREFGRENYKRANRLSNLISLCVPCHKIAEALL